MKQRHCNKKGGFSLVEVCMAVLVVGLGLMSVFAMFPSGLAASEAAQADTETGLFAEKVFFGLHAVATEVTLAQWNANTFIIPDGAKTVTTSGAETENEAKTVRYRLTCIPRGDKVKEVTLSACSLALAPPVTNVFYTEIYHMELP